MDSLQALPTYLLILMVESLFFPSKLFYYEYFFIVQKRKAFFIPFPPKSILLYPTLIPFLSQK